MFVIFIDLPIEVLDCSRTFYVYSIRSPQKNVHSIRVQWNPSKMDTIGEMKYVLYMEVSLFKGFSKILK